MANPWMMTLCRGCNKDGGMMLEWEWENDWWEINKYHAWQRGDAYGIPTGLWCDKCYNGDTYPYRTDNYYDPAYAGENLEEV